MDRDPAREPKREPIRDPRFSRIVWHPPNSGRTTAVFLGPKAAATLKRIRAHRERESE